MPIEVRDEEDIVKMGTEYAMRTLEIRKQMAELKADLKVVKSDAKLDGVPTGIIDKTVTKMLRELKKSESQKSEEEIWFEKLSENEEIQDKVAEVNNIE